ncbi:uncharacterized protein [Cardiocondyla obscurior]|uniref:uncharacterized protein n=1 Tax=Cardiocondyla obscurior TaxID=286306 RepID=UPI0039658BF3
MKENTGTSFRSQPDDVLPSTASIAPEEFDADEQTVLENRGVAPGIFFSPAKRKYSRLFHLILLYFLSAEIIEDQSTERQVSFSDTPQEHVTLETEEPSLLEELFGEEQSTLASQSWDSAIFNAAKTEVRSGLKEELRQKLLVNHELKGELAALGPLKINKELTSALFKQQAVIKRDEYQIKRQIQVGAFLNAIDSGLTDLIRLHQKSFPQEGDFKPIITKQAEGLHLLAVIQFRLSIARQAYIKPCLTFVGKSATDFSTVDDWLFGTNFAENLKSAQTCEKMEKELTKSTPSTSSTVKISNQPTRQPTFQRSNYKASARTSAAPRR